MLSGIINALNPQIVAPLYLNRFITITHSANSFPRLAIDVCSCILYAPIRCYACTDDFLVKIEEDLFSSIV
jgi:hypothetical protein